MTDSLLLLLMMIIRQLAGTILTCIFPFTGTRFLGEITKWLHVTRRTKFIVEKPVAAFALQKH
jgi:hypothetical protein